MGRCRGVWGVDFRVRKVKGIARACKMTCMAHGNSQAPSLLSSRFLVRGAGRFWGCGWVITT